ncbi:MAG: restriction endonuclease [Sphingopyxis sp.]|nr:MAG: restriction endonuclease [Sphingopyxis sp.]
MSDLHHEKHLETYVVKKLTEQGWLLGDTKGFNQDTAVYTEDLEAWIKETQGQKWDKLVAQNGERARGTLLSRLDAALAKHGTIQVLRRGFSIAGCGQIDMSEAAPEDQRNETILERYDANRLRVVPQLKYHPGRELAIDLGLFINGLPVATVELKTDFTQSAESAREQYKRDRQPEDPATGRKHPLLTFKRGAIVHFAMSDSEIWMATKLAGENTYFLPFNRGHDGKGGNPPRDDGEYPVAYFWEEICQPDAFLRIFNSFVYVEKKDVVDLKGNWSVKETLIFPRFHQHDAVSKMIADAKEKGPGHAYLCEHSAGSGKTSTIAWTAHDLTKLRYDDGKAIFDTVIIVTDRTVLDGQLQDAVQQIDHRKGMIAAIDRETSSKTKTAQLAEAILKGVPIIVVTLQTFPHAMEAILTETSLKDRSFAVIIDEAHTSQTGSTASKLQATLALSSAKDTANMTVEELLTEIQKSRARPKNLSHFAFTATPKHSTLMLFGRPEDPSCPAGPDNLPRAFHKYEMRQAIDEGFILDVLKGYISYKTAFNLGKELEDKKRVDGKAAKRALAKWMSLHPTNVTQKVQFIMKHFRHNVSSLLDGKAKAMVVTSSRAAAVRYKKAFDAFVAANPQYKDVRALVAFSGKLSGKDVMHSADAQISGDLFVCDDDAEFTESNMNTGVAVKDLRIAFDRPEFRVMLVANKFQTGFDQPKLVAMYVDKKIANEVEIVQTLSRLNRTFPGKEETFIVDFVNDPEAIRAAFKKYDSGAQITEVQDPNVVYDMKDGLDQQGIYSDEDIEAFKVARFETAKTFDIVKGGHHKAMFAATQKPTDLFNARLKALRDEAARCEIEYLKAIETGDDATAKKAEHERMQVEESIGRMLEFKSGLSRFSRTYTYIAQLLDLGDPSMENFAAFTKLLANRLNGIPPEHVDLRGIALTGYDIKRNDDQGNDGDDPDPNLNPTGSGGSNAPGKLPVYLQELIERLNGIFGEAAPIQDQATFVNQIVSITRENSIVRAQVQENSKDQALKGSLPGAVQGAVVRAMGSNNALATHLLKEDRQSLSILTNLIYDLIKQGKDIDLGDLDAA